MAWTVGPFAVDAGEAVRVAFDWGGAYKGNQAVSARPITTPLGGGLFEVAGRWELWTVDPGVTGERTPEHGDRWTYGVTVRNVGDSAAVFLLAGGEVAL